MATTFSEIQRRVFIGFPRTDGEAILAVQQSINDVIKIVASMEDAESLLTTDTTNAHTAISTKSYDVTVTWGLTRPKDIHDIRLISGSESRSLVYVPHKDVDKVIPYPEQNTTSKSIWYTTFGSYAELFPIPDAIYDLTIRYSQWPAALTSGTDYLPYEVEWDHIIVFLAKDLANAYLNGNYIQASQKAYDFLKLGIKAANGKPDALLFATGFQSQRQGNNSLNNYWKDPFVATLKGGR